MNSEARAATGSGWLQPPSDLKLDEGELHIWLANLASLKDRIRDFHGTLSGEERARAGRFVFAKDREQFILGRGFLRALLAGYLREQPGALQFHYSAHGKPHLCGGPESGRVSFNVSHSQGMALVGVARDGDIGVDVEWVRADIDAIQVARQFFSDREVEALELMPPERRTEAFFEIWTCKEAYVKARGLGLLLSTRDFDVIFRPGEPIGRVHSREPANAESRWTVRRLDPGPGIHAAVAIQDGDWQMKCFRWDGATG